MKKNKSFSISVASFILISIFVLFTCYEEPSPNTTSSLWPPTLKIISSTENSDLEPIIQQFADKNDINIKIDYAGTIEIMDKLNMGEKYDAVWTSNSIWLYMLDKNIHLKNSKSTSINPVVFAIKKSKAKSLGLMDKEVYTKDILEAINAGKLKFSMSSATQTNTGATAYLGFLTTLAGNPEILTEKHLEDELLQDKIEKLFSGMIRNSGSEEFLESMLLKGDYEAVITYETSIININKKLVKQGKEPLYIIYTKDGVSISDSPLAYIDNSNEEKLAQFTKLQNFILSNEGQKELVKTGRRVWYGGTNNKVDKKIFNPDWGIDTTKYLAPVKYPSTAVIKKALFLYQSELRKPTHIVFCLDYSGSMYGVGNKELTDAMAYILNKDEASKNLLQFSKKDKISVVAFNDTILARWSSSNGIKTEELISQIKNLSTGGQTNIYLPTVDALNILDKEDINKYNLSIVLMTDGMSNRGEFSMLESNYQRISKDIPIFCIMFGRAEPRELTPIVNLTNGKIFDGKTNLLGAFKEVRGYN